MTTNIKYQIKIHACARKPTGHHSQVLWPEVPAKNIAKNVKKTVRNLRMAQSMKRNIIFVFTKGLQRDVVYLC
jgi:hypothetical protein